MSLAPITHEGITVDRDQDARGRGMLVAFSDRAGGVSRPPYDSLNLAARVGDEPGAVEDNRARVARAAGFEVSSLVLARQVHGTRVLEVDGSASGIVGEADALVTRSPGVVLAILSADCAPVVLAGPDGVGIVHAGWRGLVRGVIQAGLEALGAATSAWIGPSIRACCYEVGPEVTEAFAGAGLPVAAARRVDPPASARSVLERAGVERIEMMDACTSCNARYFSHRRDGRTGRQGSFVSLLEDPS